MRLISSFADDKTIIAATTMTIHGRYGYYYERIPQKWRCANIGQKECIPLRFKARKTVQSKRYIYTVCAQI